MERLEITRRNEKGGSLISDVSAGRRGVGLALDLVWRLGMMVEIVASGQGSDVGWRVRNKGEKERDGAKSLQTLIYGRPVD